MDQQTRMNYKNSETNYQSHQKYVVIFASLVWAKKHVGKTTLCRRLLDRPDFKNVPKTRAIETHIYSAVIAETGNSDFNVNVEDVQGM